MSTIVNRLDFKQRYPAIRQGLFVVPSLRCLPKGQDEINIGRSLSAALVEIPEKDRPDSMVSLIAAALSRSAAASLTHIEILFTPELHLDVVGALLSQCRNRKLCIVWPGAMDGVKLYYATPENPEYYECDTRPLQDTYIITE